MTHPVHRAACAFAIAALLLAPIGCASASNQSETTDSPAPATSAPQDAAPAAIPPAPSDVSGMRAWFEEAYPAASWLARIKGVEHVPGEVPGSGGFANAVVITTDLDFASEQAIAQEIVAALGEAHPAWAKQFVIRYADGNNIQAGDITDPTP